MDGRRGTKRGQPKETGKPTGHQQPKCAKEAETGEIELNKGGSVSLRQKFGIPNAGRTCYINATLNLLASIPLANDVTVEPFKTYFEGILGKKINKPKARFLKDSLDKLDAFATFRGFSDQDARDFLTAVLHSDGFGGIRESVDITIQDTLKCTLCQREGDPVYRIESLLLIPRKNTFEESVEQEINSGEKLVRRCSHRRCLGQEAVKIRVVSRAPPYLFIASQIFTSIENKEVKLKGMNTPEQLQLGEVGYDLVGTVRHIGKKLDRGHFISYLYYENEYIKFDDERKSGNHTNASLKGDNFICLFKRKDM